MKKSIELVVEYLVAYEQKILLFYAFKKNRFISRFDYIIKQDDDFLELMRLYKEFISNYSLPSFNKCNLLISSFDSGVSNIKIPRKTLFPKGIINNFFIDSYGLDYKKTTYICDVKKGKATSTIHSFFFVSNNRIREAEQILTTLGIDSFAVSLTNQCLNRLLKTNSKIDNCFLLFNRESYSLLSVVKNGQISHCYFIDYNSQMKQLNNLCNILISLNEVISKDYNINDLYIIGNRDIDSSIYDLGLNAIRLPDVPNERFITLGLNKKYSPLIKDEISAKTKKKKFNWKKFLGIKKGFTLIECAVSIAIFAIVATLTSTFIVVSTNTNLNSKRSILAQSYVNNISEIFTNNPHEDNIRSFTKYLENDLIGKPHIYFLNHQMDVSSSSSSSTNMTYRVSFQYEIYNHNTTEFGVVQPYVNYIFTISSISSIGGNKSYIEQTIMKVIE